MQSGSHHVDSNTLLGVAEGLDLVLISNDEVLVQFGTRSHPSELLRDTELKGILGAIVDRLLRAPTTLSDLLLELPVEEHTEALSLIDDLVQRGIFTNVLNSPVEQYLRYTFSGESTLAKRSVSIIGAGPIGARLAHTLLQQGLGRLTLLDDRPVNHLWYSFLPLGSPATGHAGRAANQVLRDHLFAAGYTGVEYLDARLDLSGVAAAISASDFTVVALEQPDLSLAHLVNRLCIRHRKPWMLVTIDGNLGLVGPLFLPVHTACYNDYRTLIDAATPSPEMARKHRQHLLKRDAGSFFPGLPVYAEMVASHAGLAIVHFLLCNSSFALGRVLVIDFERMRIDLEDVLKLPRCPVCGTEKGAYQPPFPVDVVTRSTAQ